MWSTFWLVIQIVFTLLPRVLEAIKEERNKQKGRDEVIEAVLNRFDDVEKRAEKARNDATDRLDDGLPDDRFRRD